MAYSLEIPNLLDAFEAAHGEDNVVYAPGTSFDQIIDLDRAVKAAQRVDTIVCVLAEKPSTEAPGNIGDLRLPAAQTALVKALSFGKPLVVVLLTDRPRLVTEADSYANATLFASRPGPFGGQAIYEVLTGDYNPSGKLPFTYPRSPNSLLTYDHKLSEETANGAGEPGFHPLYEFGHGLSYTTFAYANLGLAADSLTEADTLEISIDLTNTGQVDGSETVQVYVRDLYASITPPVKRLRAFRKIHLAAGATETVTFSIPVFDLAFAGSKNKFILEPGDFEVRIGNKTASFQVTDNPGGLPPLPE
jgi:beta-glucosidase